MITVKHGVFHLQNEKSSYLFHVRDGFLEHLHFGTRLSASDADALAVRPGNGWGDSTLYREGSNANCLDIFPLEWSGCGRGDYRESPMELLQNGAPISTEFHYTGCEALKSAHPSALPASRGQTVLAVYLEDSAAKLRLTLLYGVLPTVFTRRAILENCGDTPISIRKLMSANTDLPGDWTLHTFSGGWIAEMQHTETPVTMARTCLESTTGASSSRANPGFLLAAPDAAETAGEVCGFNLLYSGSHYLSAQKSLQGLTRVMHGISPANFNWELAPGERFETPEAVMAWSDAGFGGITDCFGRYVNEALIPPYWKNRPRPIVYNSWEGCMFDFTEAKLLRLGKLAKQLGCELFVLDDGWFGKRDSDTSSLGDYSVNTKKLPNGLKGLGEKLNAMGLQFGLWFEPESVSPDSELYRRHPDWALHDSLGRTKTECKVLHAALAPVGECRRKLLRMMAQHNNRSFGQRSKRLCRRIQHRFAKQLMQFLGAFRTHLIFTSCGQNQCDGFHRCALLCQPFSQSAGVIFATGFSSCVISITIRDFSP